MSYAHITPVPGGSTTPGWSYHNIPGVDGASHRTDTSERVEHIAASFDLTGRYGVDLGCSVGGISFAMLDAGAARMRGYDYDRQAIATARHIRNQRNANATFTVADLTDEVTWAAIVNDRPDFVVWMSNWMWVAQQAGERFARERLELIGEHVDALIFETAEQGVSMAGSASIRTAGDVFDLLAETTPYRIVNAGPPPGDRWHGRSVFICTKD